MLLLLAACAGTGESSPAPPSVEAEPPTIPDGLDQQSRDVFHSMAGTDSMLPVGEHTTFTIGTSILNRSDEELVVEEFEVAEMAGVTATPTLMVGWPRSTDLIGSALGFPPERQWPASSEQPFGPMRQPPGPDSARWGEMVLLRVDVTAEFGYMKGYWVRGTQGGRPFEDFVDTYTAFCATDGVTDECLAFANEHAFTEMEAPPVLPPATAPTATTAPG